MAEAFNRGICHRQPLKPTGYRKCSALGQSQSTDLAVAHNVQQGHNVGPARQILQDLDLSLNLLLLNRLEYLDDAFLVVDDVDALENLAVLSAT